MSASRSCVRKVLLGSLVFAAGCASEERLQAELDEFVEEHNRCEEVSDCEMVYPGCPLGCGSGINRAHLDAAEEKAEKLIRRYERGGRSCDYGCVSGELVCEDNRCEVVDGEP